MIINKIQKIYYLFHKHFNLLNTHASIYSYIMITLTIPFFIFLVISNGFICGYPSESLYGVITNRGHNFKIFRRPQAAYNNYYFPTSNINNEDLLLFSHNYHPHKRLIDF